MAEDWFTKQIRDPEFVKGFIEEQRKMDLEDLQGAVKAETERCAKICENSGMVNGTYFSKQIRIPR